MNRVTLNYLKTALLFVVPGAVLALSGDAIAGRTGLSISVAVYALFAAIAFFSAERMVLRRHRAKYIPEGQAPGLHALLHELARRARLPSPALYLLPEPAPQILVIGRNIDRGAIALSSGLLECLSGEELAAVIAHALHHLRCRETCFTTLAAALANALISASNFSRSTRMLMAPVAAALIRSTVHPSRQFRADEASALLIGDARPLHSALQKIQAYGPRVAPECVCHGTAHLFLTSPLSEEGPDRWFQTHPPIAERLQNLQSLGRRPVIRPEWLEVHHANK